MPGSTSSSKRRIPSCDLRALRVCRILIAGIGGAAERSVEKSMRAAYDELPLRAANYLAQKAAAAPAAALAPAAAAAAAARSAEEQAVPTGAASPEPEQDVRPWTQAVARCVAPQLAKDADLCASLREAAARHAGEARALRDEARRKDDEIALLTEGLQGCILQLKATAERNGGGAQQAPEAVPPGLAGKPAAPPAAAAAAPSSATAARQPKAEEGDGAMVAGLRQQVEQRDAALGVASQEILRERRERHEAERSVRELQHQLAHAQEAIRRQQALLMLRDGLLPAPPPRHVECGAASRPGNAEAVLGVVE
eukprot:Transcript_9197.p2 GENE.Transcript_9197~~Transcript_9197.p2  ORF type:complete len:311 (-),score=97.61 Transcript_9197:42-974(-)